MSHDETTHHTGHRLCIVPDDGGGFRIEGLAGTRHDSVSIDTEDDTVATARGEAVFLGRTVTGRLFGQPAVTVKT